MLVGFHSALLPFARWQRATDEEMDAASRWTYLRVSVEAVHDVLGPCFHHTRSCISAFIEIDSHNARVLLEDKPDPESFVCIGCHRCRTVIGPCARISRTGIVPSGGTDGYFVDAFAIQNG